MSAPTEEMAFWEYFQKPGKKRATSTCIIAGLYGPRFSGGVIVCGRGKKGAIIPATSRAGRWGLCSRNTGNFFEEQVRQCGEISSCVFSSDRMKSVVPGNNHERDAGRVEPFKRSGHGRVGPGPGPDCIKKVARVDEYVGLLPDDLINRELVKIIVDLPLAQGSWSSGL